jgi:hypothetical protein
MEGFNPNQSLLPAVGGHITPMSGGAKIQVKTGVFTILGLTEIQFTDPKNIAILRMLAPIRLGAVTDMKQFFEDESADNTELEKEVLTNAVKLFGKDIISYWDSDKENGITKSNMGNLKEALKGKKVDLSKVQITLNPSGLEIKFNESGRTDTPYSRTGPRLPVSASSGSSSGPLVGRPSSSPSPPLGGPPLGGPPLTSPPAVVGGLAEAAKKAAEDGLTSNPI